MKARLYRGPGDGRTMMVPDGQNVIHIDVLADDPNLTFKQGGSLPVVQANYHRTRHTHPDGSVYFEWDKPKGTKSGVRQKRNPKTTKFNTVRSIYGNTAYFPSVITTTGTTAYSITVP